MEDDDDGYLEYLSEGGAQTLRGNPPGLQPSFNDQQYQHQNFTHQHFQHYGQVPMTMAATAPDFNARARTYVRRDQKTHVDNPVDEYWHKNRPVLKKTEWSSIHIKLPVVAPTTANTKIKNSIFGLLTQRLEAAEGDWKDKAELFASLFVDQVPAADIEATLAIGDMDAYSTTVFEFADFQLLDSDYKALPIGTAADFLARTRENVRFFKFTLLANPRNINSAGMSVDATSFPSPVTTTVYLRALRYMDALHPHITKALVQTTPKFLMNIYDNENQDFSLSQKTTHEFAPNPDTQQKWLNTLKAKTKYEAMKQLIKALYVGRLEGTERLSSRIERIKQRGWNPAEKRFNYKSVTELHQDYQFELQEVTKTMAPETLPDLENAFYRALSTDIQTRVIDRLHATPPTSVIENVNRLNEFVTVCLQEEINLKTITSVAQRAVTHQSKMAYQSRNPQMQRGPRTFTTLPNQADQYTALPPLTGQPHEYAPNQETHYTASAPLMRQQQHGYAQRTYPNQPPLANQHLHQQYPPAPQAYATLPPYPPNQHSTPYSQGPHEHVVLPYAFICSPTSNCTQDQQITLTAAILAMDEACQTLTAVSIVEEALQNASGMKAPMKCFGCDGIPEYSNNCFHLWRNCPNKNDNRTWTNFQQNLRNFREKRRNTQRNDDPNWNRAGYPNQQMQDQFRAIANPDTSATNRRVMIATLTQDLQDSEATDDQETTPTKKTRRSRRIARNFLMYSQPQAPDDKTHQPKSFLGAPPLSRYEFKIAYKLPFMKFPIGDGATSEDCATLSGLADTGGCCNMGSLSYHREISQRYPHLVHEFVDLEEKRYEHINIGGLQGGVALTHMIKYYIPYTDRGGTCILTLGLTEDLPIDTLFGVNFQTEAKMQIDLAARKIWSGYFQDSYEIEFKEPKRTDIAHITSQIDQHPKALAAIKND
jgi:hypothetical protein